MKSLMTLLASGLLVVGVNACGSGGESPSTSASGTTTPTASQPTSSQPSSGRPSGTTSTTPAPSNTATGSSAGGESSSSTPSSQANPSSQGDTSIQTFGQEAGQPEKQAVTQAVKRYYAAVAAGNGAAACGLLALPVSKSIVQGFGRSPSLRGKGCAGILSLLFGRRPNQASQAAVEVTGVRIKGSRGFAIVHSTETPAGAMPVYLEGGAWKIGELAAGPL